MDNSIITGRRKEATARVRVVSGGKGIITVNGKKFVDYFNTIDQRMQVRKAMAVAQMDEKIDILANVRGGGKSGQAGAISLGIARALVLMNPELRPIFRKEDLLTRDPRAKERKKYGRKGARKRFQWTKR
jgi:small subunit ribosomal protein S9